MMEPEMLVLEEPSQAQEDNDPMYSLTWLLKAKLEVERWLHLRNTYHSCKGPQLSSQNFYQMAHNRL